VRRLSAILFAAAMGLGVLTLPASGATAPANDMVPAGAVVLYWTYPGTVSPSASGPTNRYFTKAIRSQATIHKVRTLINEIGPYIPKDNKICNDLRELPFTISFGYGTGNKGVTKVVFQLGGCGTATVYQSGAVQSPVLGGKGMYAKYELIQKAISPSGVPLT
jgi:hypothetical protein